jgi:hypothetical protein
MNQFNHVLRWLVRVLFALAILNMTGCDRANSIEKNSPVIGSYVISGVREAASEFQLGANGHFKYLMDYGGLAESVTGTWHHDDKQVTLVADGKAPAGWGGTTVHLRREGKDLYLKFNDDEVLYRQIKGNEPEVSTNKKSNSSFRYEEAKVDIVGYNYTDKEIGAFEVNGDGGGTMRLSSPTDGGGAPYCCFRYDTQRPYPYQVEVTWAASASDEKRTLVMATLPQPETDNLQYLEVHFYPDGHVELKLTNEYGPPRLKLSHHDDEWRR